MKARQREGLTFFFADSIMLPSSFDFFKPLKTKTEYCQIQNYFLKFKGKVAVVLSTVALNEFIFIGYHISCYNNQ